MHLNIKDFNIALFYINFLLEVKHEYVFCINFIKIYHLFLILCIILTIKYV